jgi:hypothetical protein
MVFNNGFPINYQPAQYYQQQYTQPQNQMNQTQMIQSQSQIMNGGFISVRNIEEAYNYPVAPGNSVTFKDENAPYIYTKTMGFSQLDRPVFEKFKLVREAETAQNDVLAQEPNTLSTETEKTKLDALSLEIEGIKKDISKFKSFMNQFDEDGGVENDTKQPIKSA